MSKTLDEVNAALTGPGGRRIMGEQALFDAPAPVQYTDDDTVKVQHKTRRKRSAKTLPPVDAHLVRDGVATKVLLTERDGKRSYALQVGPLAYIFIQDAHPGELLLLNKMVALESLTPGQAYAFNPPVLVTYQRADTTVGGSASWRLSLLSVKGLGKPQSEAVDLPTWARTEDDLGVWLRDMRAGLDWAKEVLGAKLAEWPDKAVCAKRIESAWADTLNARPKEVLTVVNKVDDEEEDEPIDDVWSAEKPDLDDSIREQIAVLHFKNSCAAIGSDLDFNWQLKLALQPYKTWVESVEARGFAETLQSLKDRIRYLRVVPPTARDELIEENDMAKSAAPAMEAIEKDDWLELKNRKGYTNEQILKGLSVTRFSEFKREHPSKKADLARAEKLIDAWIKKQSEQDAQESTEGDQVNGAFNEMMNEDAPASEPPEEDEPDDYQPPAQTQPEPPKPAEKLERIDHGATVATLTGIAVTDIQKALDRPLHPAAYAEMPYGKNKGETYIKRVEFLRDRLDNVFGPCGVGWSIQPHPTLGSVEHLIEERTDKNGKTQTWYVSKMNNWLFRYAVVVNGQLTWVDTSVTSAENDNIERENARKGVETTLMKLFYRKMGGQNHLVYHRYTFAQAQRDLAELQKKRAA